MTTLYRNEFMRARMVLILPEYSQRPYRYGMTLLCIGAMFNWLGLAENNAEPVRYIGVTLIAAGAMLICLAMCFWMKASHDPSNDSSQSEEAVHHIVSIHQSGESMEKPPDYDSVTGCLPPCYEDAIRLNPSLLLPNISSAHDTTDSRKHDSILPPSVSPQSSNIPAPPYSQSCAITITNDATSTKPNDLVNNAKATSTDTSESVTDESSQNQDSDNFGSKVLRLSMRLLRGRQRSQDGEASNNAISTVSATMNASQVQHPDAELPPYELTLPVSSVGNESSPSTSNLPVR